MRRYERISSRELNWEIGDSGDISTRCTEYSFN